MSAGTNCPPWCEIKHYPRPPSAMSPIHRRIRSHPGEWPWSVELWRSDSADGTRGETLVCASAEVPVSDAGEFIAALNEIASLVGDGDE